jgi:hypothetical protein
MNRPSPQPPAVDRLFAALPYLIPLMEVYGFGIFIFQQIPFLLSLYEPLMPLMQAYNNSYGNILVFLLLYFGVVSNPRVAHIIRFNALQAILLDILVFLCSLALKYLIAPIFQASIVTQSLMGAVFLGTLAACAYAIAMTAAGKYAEIPKLSEAAYMQVDRF